MRVFPPFPRVDPPASGSARDLALDLVRSWSLVLVVFGHFLMQIQFWAPGGVPVSSNALSSGDPWPYATWVFQVMPLFFVAGGAVNARSWEGHAEGWGVWVWGRVERLMRPTVVFLLACAVLFSVVTMLVRREVTDVLLPGVTGPLWFLAVYVPVTALTPWTLRWFRRAPVMSTATLVVLVVVVDALRLNVSEYFGAANLLVAWVLVHQLGYWYRRGVDARVAAALVVGGLASNLLLTWRWSWYPTSLVGIPTERFSNMAPPDAVLVCHAMVLFGLFVLLAPTLRRWCTRPRMFTATVRAGLMAMTVYLWHMLVLVGWLTALHHLRMDLPVRFEANPLGGRLVVPDGVGYWGWLLLSGCGYAALVWSVARLLWPVEFVRLPWFDGALSGGPRRPGATAVGLVLLSGGLLAVSGAGFSGFPWALHNAYGIPLSTAAAIAVVLAGLALVRLGAVPTRASETQPSDV